MPDVARDVSDMQGVRFDITPLGRDALEEAILAEDRRSQLRVLDEVEESSGDLYDCDEGQCAAGRR